MASDSKAKVLRDGERYVQQGKISLAISEYLKIAKEEPEDVLTLNTLGDLYLRQGKVSDANRLFLRVADNYARNNFLLKAIAVYKKILNIDPKNMEVNLLLASLCARQGMNVEARSQYMYICDMCAREGKTSESLEAYEKVVEIDPMNAPMQLKLAESYLAKDGKEKAQLLFVGAARALMKTGDIVGAMASFRRALAINLTSSEALKGFLESALQANDLQGALDQVKESISSVPDDPAIQELLGRAYLASGDLEHAEPCFRAAIRTDDSRYGNFLVLSKLFLEAGDPDRALGCLDQIAPVLICRRETARLAEAYDLILADHPAHLATLKKLADILTGTNEDVRQVAVLEKMTQLYQNSGSPAEALETVAKILEIHPESETHLAQHRQLFEQAFPGASYKKPRGVMEAQRKFASSLDASAGIAAVGLAGDDNTGSAVIEVDLLLNYGMKDKALQLLRTLEAKRPTDKEVKLRLLSLYGESGEHRRAAEQCVLLSVLHRKSGDLVAAQKSWDEAGKLAPDWANADLDVTAFARERGINLEAAKGAAPVKETGGSQEVDLSGDLSEIFFKDAQGDGQGVPGRVENQPGGPPDAIAEEFPQEIPQSPAPESIEEQMQEVDFYIRLGFQDEARAKLDEIALAFPGHPELAPRYTQLGLAPTEAANVIALAPPEPSLSAHPTTASEPGRPAHAPLVPAGVKAVASPSSTRSDLSESDLQIATGRFGENQWFEPASKEAFEMPARVEAFAVPPVAESTHVPPAMSRSTAEVPDNSMFADLIAEVNSLTDQEIALEDFETHFNLGTAFHEMGLIEDAIKEFQTSVKALNPSKSPKETIQCCGMLSTCFLEKGMPRSAIRWCQTGLNIKEISSHEATALRYDMGVAHAMAGDPERALECFGTIFGVDPSYRDVAQRIDDLKSGLERHAP